MLYRAFRTCRWTVDASRSSAGTHGSGHVGYVDLTDLSFMLAAFGSCVGDPAYNPVADIDHSGCVELADLARLLANFGT